MTYFGHYAEWWIDPGFIIQGGFFTGPPLNVLSFRSHSKSHRKSSKCQNFLRVWVIFGADQSKNRPVQWLVISFSISSIWFWKRTTGCFFYWSALKMTKCQTLRKFWHLELFRWDLHVIWHLVIFRADQLKKPPCMNGLCKYSYSSGAFTFLYT